MTLVYSDEMGGARLKRLAPPPRRRAAGPPAVAAAGWASLALAVLWLTGCATSDSLLDEDLLSQQLRNRGLDPEHVVIPFELTEEPGKILIVPRPEPGM